MSHHQPRQPKGRPDGGQYSHRTHDEDTTSLRHDIRGLIEAHHPGRTASAIAAGAAIIVATAGCAVVTHGTHDGDHPGKAIVATSPAVQKPTNGATITETEARTLNADVESGWRGYQMPDGSFVAVSTDPAQPVPAPVIADASSRLQAANARADGDKASLAASTVASQLNRDALFVYSVQGTVPGADGPVPVTSWVVFDGTATDGTVYATRDSALAAAGAVASGRPVIG